MKNLVTAITILFLTINVYSQQNLSEIINENTSKFRFQNNNFSGEGWDKILTQVKKHNTVLIGEDHFFNEIPLFVSKITSEVKFDNFFCELDPYSTKILEEKINTLSDDKLNEYLKKYGNTLSFYALLPEFNLLKDLVLSNTNIIGTDQIVLTADKLIASKSFEITDNKIAKKIYSIIEKDSEKHFNLFIEGKGSPYFFTNEFDENLKKLDDLNLSSQEKLILKDLKLSREIYTTQNHHLRIQLMKNNILKNINLLKGKSLFKYGAIHMSKSESFFGGYDIGNLVDNITDANFNSSLHIMIIGKEGMQGVPFKGMKPEKIDYKKGDLKYLTHFFDTVEGDNWHVFDMKKIAKKARENKVDINDKKLLQTLKGYDYLIVIPKVSAATFIN